MFFMILFRNKFSILFLLGNERWAKKVTLGPLFRSKNGENCARVTKTYFPLSG